MDSITIEGREFKCLVKRKAIRSVRVKLKSAYTLEISCPYFTPDIVLKKFISENSIWIQNQMSRLASKPPILNRQTITILGKDYDITFIKTSRDSVIIEENEHKIYVNLSVYTESNAEKIIEHRLKRLSLNLIKTELRLLKEKFGFNYQKVSVKNQKTRFGSCSSQGNLNFNWQIVFFPKDKFVHILLHELTHLKIKNHQKEFWRQLSVYDPYALVNDKWLRTEGTKYFIM